MTARHERRPAHRFSGRAEAYLRHRPRYPAQLLEWLRDTIAFAPSWVVADVGSGTGMLTSLLLANGNPVYAVEPNAEMRAAAERILADQPRFHSVAGSAEATGLADASVDLVTAAQAFHWFDPEPTRLEWMRILRPGGWVLVVFNSRRTDATPFMRAHEELLRVHSVDYQAVDHRRDIPTRLRGFLGDWSEWRYRFVTSHDYGGLKGLSESSSYVPAPGHPQHAAFYAGLRRIFDQHATDGRVEFPYETEAFVGRPS